MGQNTKLIKVEIEFDRLTDTYSTIISNFPIIYGEGSTSEEAIENLIDAIIEIVELWKSDINKYNDLMNSEQLDYIKLFDSCSYDRDKIRELLKV